jgi:hypothetical protein
MIFKRIVTAFCLAAILLSLASTAVSASKYHEDPTAVQENFSGMSLLLYYSGLLDMVQQGNYSDIESAISKLDFANLPAVLKKTNSDLAARGIDLFQSMRSLSIAWQKYRQLIERVQPYEFQPLIEQVSREITKSRENLDSIELSVNVIGKYLKIDSLPPSNGLRVVYEEIIDKITQLKEFVENVDIALEQGQQLIKSRQATNLSLEGPSIALFPGDEAAFSGFLTAGSAPMAGRDIEIRLDNVPFSSVQSDATGFFKGSIKVPYSYIPEMSLQAFYLPADADAGIYQGSVSPIRQLRISFYQADLRIETEDKAYPGRELAFTVKLEYAPGTPLQSREAEIYLDDSLTGKFAIRDSSMQKIQLDPALSIGKHTLTVSIKSEGMYAPVSEKLPLDVTLAVPVLEMATPGTVMVPGKLIISGKVSSETGQMQNARISLEVRNSTAVIKTDDEGRFETTLLLGLGVDLLGNQTISVKVQPEEPWNKSLAISKKIFMVNLPSCAILLVVLAALCYYLPRRFKFRLRKAPVVKKPKYSTPAPAAQSIQAAADAKEGGDNLIFDLYRFALKIVTAITRAVLKPQQTLREFALENNKALGSLSRYFNDFTRLIERLLYSRHKATDADLKKSRELYDSMNKEARHEDL